MCANSRRREWPVCKEHCEEVEGGGRSHITEGLCKASKEFGFGSKCNDQPFKQEEMSEQWVDFRSRPGREWKQGAHEEVRGG